MSRKRRREDYHQARSGGEHAAVEHSSAGSSSAEEEEEVVAIQRGEESVELLDNGTTAAEKKEGADLKDVGGRIRDKLSILTRSDLTEIIVGAAESCDVMAVIEEKYLAALVQHLDDQQTGGGVHLPPLARD